MKNGYQKNEIRRSNNSQLYTHHSTLPTLTTLLAEALVKVR